MKRRRFCMVTSFYPPFNFGGDGIFVRRLANALASRGHELHVIHDRAAYELLAERPVGDRPYGDHPDIRHYPVRHTRLPAAELLLSHQLGRPVAIRAELTRLLETLRPDVIHYHNISLLGGPAVLELGDAIKICTLHDYWFVCPTHALWRMDREACTRRSCVRCTLHQRRPPQLWRSTRTVSRMAGHVDCFLAPSRFSVEAHLANGFPAPIRRLPHFVASPADSGASAAAPARPYFLYAGRLETLKGVHKLIDAVRRLDGVDLVVAGEGTRTPELRRRAAALPGVRFTGWIDGERLERLMRDACAVVIPSLCYESFGLVGVEAFAAGVPVIANRIGALAELVQGGGGGMTYTSEDELVEAMQRLVSSPGLKRELGEKARRSYLERYTEELHLARYLEIIDELEGRGSGVSS